MLQMKVLKWKVIFKKYGLLIKLAPESIVGFRGFIDKIVTFYDPILFIITRYILHLF